MPRKNPRRNISRIETVSSSGHISGGWEVRIQRRGVRHHQYFSDGEFGGKRASLTEAKQFRDEIESAHEKYTVKELGEFPSTRNRSGVVGVRLHQQKDVRGDYVYQYWYWVAQWTDGHGKRKTRSFSIHQHGDEEAYRMAVECRETGVRMARR